MSLFPDCPGIANQPKAADFSVLFIAICTLIIVTRSHLAQDSTCLTKVLVSASIWVVPLITSAECHPCPLLGTYMLTSLQGSTAAGLGALGPVSGNWCWIVESRTDLRYGLGHGIRYAIIISTIVIYTVIFTYLQPLIKSLSASASASKSDCVHHDEQSDPRSETTASALAPTDVEMQMDIISAKKDAIVIVNVDVEDPSKAYTHRLPPAVDVRSIRKTQINRLMILKAYPILYIVLWLPGIANRIAEATGHPTRALQVLQASTQFIGLADSVTYLIQDHLLKD